MRFPHPAITAGALMLACYWAALMAGVKTPLVTHWAYLALLTFPTCLVVVRAVRVREDRFAWASLGVGLSLWTLGSIWQVVAHLRGIAVVSPGFVDALWLTIYPCTLLTFGALARPWVRGSGTALGRDALMIMLVAAAVVTAFVLPQVAINKGNLSAAGQVVFSAYPISDSVLLSVALVGAAVAGRRAGAVWWLFATGIIVLVGGDVLWALQAAAGTWQPVMGSNAVTRCVPGSPPSPPGFPAAAVAPPAAPPASAPTPRC